MHRRPRAEATVRVRLRMPTAGAVRRRGADCAAWPRTRHPGRRLRNRDLLGLARVQPLCALAIAPSRCAPGGRTASPDGLRDVPLDPHPIVAAPEARPALTEFVRAAVTAAAIER